MKRQLFIVLTAVLALSMLLAACGGGDPPITSVKVMGDSLADSGTFGLKFTVQGSAPTAPAESGCNACRGAICALAPTGCRLTCPPPGERHRCGAA